MTIETEDVPARLERGAKQLYRDYENTTAEHAELIFSSEDAECKSLADEMREWFRTAVDAAGFVSELQSLSERIASLEAQVALLAGIEEAPAAQPKPIGPVQYGDDRLPKKIWDQIEVNEDGCWFWKGRIGTFGYGQISGKYQDHNAHRYVYAALVEPVPKDMVCDHLCRVRHCVNPAHVEPVTNGENVRRGNVLSTGDNARFRKLSAEQVKIIYSHKGQRGMGKRLAERFNIGPGAIYKIWSGEYWGSVTGASLIKEGEVMRNSGGARPSDQALAVPVEPVARLDPPGFDPSRIVDCPRCHQTCGWCGDYRHMHGLLKLPGAKRGCDLPLKPEGDACPLCHGKMRVRAVTHYESLGA